MIGKLIPLDRAGLLVALDCETTGLHPDPPENARVSVVSLAWDLGKGVQGTALPFEFGRSLGGQATLDLEPDPNMGGAEWVQLLDWLERQRLVMHPMSFDCMMMATGTARYEGRPLEDRVVWDTQIASRELDPGESAELADLERRVAVLDTDTRASWLQSEKLRAKVNSMEWLRASAYATVDAIVTLTAAHHQMERYETGEGHGALYARELRQARALVRTERRGIGYDFVRSREVAKEVAKAESSIRVGLPFKATLHGAKRYYFTTLGLEPLATTETGQPRLDDQEVERLVGSGAPFAKDFHELRSLETARSKWYESYAEHAGWDGRLRTRFSQSKVVSGRLSSTRVNLQAIPHDYQLMEIVGRGWPTPRQLFRPRDGARLWELDLNQAELRVAAVEAGCEPMLELIRAGADLHGEVTSMLFGVTPDSVDWYEKRQIGKRADFSFIFGVGADTFQRDLFKLTGIHLSLTECESIVLRWRKRFPEFGRAINRYMDRANHNGYLRLVNGRVRHFTSYEDRHKAFNQYVQGSLAELMKDWIIEVDRRWPGILVLTIHDSLVLETADEVLVKEAAELGAQFGTELFSVPMSVDTKEWNA